MIILLSFLNDVFTFETRYVYAFIIYARISMHFLKISIIGYRVSVYIHRHAYRIAPFWSNVFAKRCSIYNLLIIFHFLRGF